MTTRFSVIALILAAATVLVAVAAIALSGRTTEQHSCAAPQPTVTITEHRTYTAPQCR